MNKKHVWSTVVLTAALVMTMGTTAYARGWEQDSNGWYYEPEDGTYLSGGFSQINGRWYYFNGDGYMCTGWVQDGANWYYMDDSGAMLANTTTPDGKYWLDANGVWDGKTIGASAAVPQTSSLERNTMKATIDGVEETFYLVHTGKTAGGRKNFSAYSVKSDGTIGKKLTLGFGTNLKPGITVTAEDDDYDFSMTYKDAYNGFQYAARKGKGSYTCGITVNESEASHMEGTFSATTKMIDGSGTVQITNGSFNLYYGEQIDWVKALVPAKTSGGGSYAGVGGYDAGSSSGSGSSTSIDHTCRTCHGSGLCKSCAGRGEKRRSSDGKVRDCNICRGSGSCSICYGTGKVY